MDLLKSIIVILPDFKFTIGILAGSGMKFNMGQWLSIPFILAGVLMMVWTKMKPCYFNQTPLPKRPKKSDKKK